MMGVITVGVLFACYGVAFNIIFGSTGQLFLCSGALAGHRRATAPRSSPTVPDCRCCSRLVLATIALVRGRGAAELGVGEARARHDLHRHRHDRVRSVVPELRARQGRLDRWRERAEGVDRVRLLDQRADPAVLHLPRACSSCTSRCIARCSARGSAGRSRALRDDGLAAELSGVDVSRYRILAGALGGAMLGLAGGLYVFTESRASPVHLRVRQRRRVGARHARVRRHRVAPRAQWSAPRPSRGSTSSSRRSITPRSKRSSTAS